MNHKRLLDDKILICGITVGILSDSVKLISNYTAYKIGFTKVVFWQIVATRFLEQKDLYKPTALIIGAVADITISAVLGVVFILFLYLSSQKYLYLKGLGFGLLIWVSIFGTLLGQSVQDKIPQEPSGILVTIVAHSVFGLAMSFFSGIIYKRYVLRKNH